MTSETTTGVYIAYPRAREFQVVHEGPDTLVNNRYTRVGFTRDSFAASGRAYRCAFGNQVKFIPVAEIPCKNMPQLKKLILGAVALEHKPVGSGDSWFDTQDREAIISLIYRLLTPAANDGGDGHDGSIEKTG